MNFKLMPQLHRTEIKIICGDLAEQEMNRKKRVENEKRLHWKEIEICDGKKNFLFRDSRRFMRESL